MTYDSEQHHRRSIRLSGYDYADAGAYFVTLCSEDHVCPFGEIVGNEMCMNNAGCMVQVAWDGLSVHYPGVSTDAFVVMPNHIHGIIVLSPVVGAGPRACPDSGACTHQEGPAPSQEGQPRGVAPTNGNVPSHTRAMTLGDVVARFKTLTTKRYADGVKLSGWPAFPGRLWQRNYYEHVIRDRQALDHIRRYILGNPACWAQDRENPAATTPEDPDAWRVP